MSSRRRSRWFKGLLVVVLLAGGGIGTGWYYREYHAAEGPRYQTGVISRGELLQTVKASGQLNPVTMVEVGSQISGIIQELLANFNSTVKKGQLIARIDPAAYEAWYIEAEGDLANAKAALELAQLDEQRAKALRADKLNPQADYDKALASLHQAEANVKIKEGAMKNAQVNLERCSIYAPIDGLVLSRNVNVGQTVAASLSAPTLFVIANDLTKMQIEANVAEADIGLVEPGQEAEFKVDAFPGQTFRGKVAQVRNSPKTDQNVVTYSTMIEVDNDKLKLKPGMTATVNIIVARREAALRIPNAALRFRPPKGWEFKPARQLAAGATEAGPEEKKSTGKAHSKDKRKNERMVYLVGSQPGSTNSPAAGGVTGDLLQPVQIKTGISDAAYTEVVEGLKEGDEVAVGSVAAKGGSRAGFNPFSIGKRS
jgi:HlyD family secretion protein